MQKGKIRSKNYGKGLFHEERSQPLWLLFQTPYRPAQQRNVPQAAFELAPKGVVTLSCILKQWEKEIITEVTGDS